MKRFYKEAAVEQTAQGWRATLDGRPIRTAGGNPQVVPTQALAKALAAEWAAQGDQIEPSTFQYRDLADFTIDAVAPDRARTIVELLPYAETDTLCYRADPDEHLYKRQVAEWEPLLRGFEQRHAVSFVRVSGIVHRPQPTETMAALQAHLATLDDFALAALKMLSSLSASLVIAMLALEADANAQALWKAAELEADWQAELWGEDWEAAERRATRFTAFRLAMDFARASR